MAPRRILIAASSVADRQLLREILVQLDKRSTFLTASDGQEVMNILHSYPLSSYPDLFITEYRLPGLPAEEFLGLLNRAPLAPFILKVIWSAPTDYHNRQHCQTLGVHLMLPKEILPSDLKVALGNLLLSFPKGLIL